MIDNTSTDLRDILRQSDGERKSDIQESEPATASTTACSGQTDTDEERLSIEYCLDVCAQILNHVDRVQTQLSARAGIRPREFNVVGESSQLNSARFRMVKVNSYTR
jgi:hypothetical protein